MFNTAVIVHDHRLVSTCINEPKTNDPLRPAAMY